MQNYAACSPKDDMVAMRSQSVQLILKGSEQEGYQLLRNYQQILINRWSSFMNTVSSDHHPTQYLFNMTLQDPEEFFLAFYLSETQGGIRVTTKLPDLALLYHKIQPMSEKIRFRLGVGLSKLGLHDLSLRHVGLSALPWEAPLYRLRAKLVFSSIHSSLGSLARAINQFEKQIENILLLPMSYYKRDTMISICNSFNEAALALQALPLLHLTGFSAPRMSQSLGHLPISLPVLLSEVYARMCPIDQPSSKYFSQSINKSIQPIDIDDDVTLIQDIAMNSHALKKKLTIGIVAGSFDGLPGRLMIGLFEELNEKIRKNIRFIAMCFPTPRSSITDRVNGYFDQHINLSPDNKTQVIERILSYSSQFDLLLFMDAGYDARIFALAHERLAKLQAIYYSYGTTLGIPTIDYYFIPEIFWDIQHTRCPLASGVASSLHSSFFTGSSSSSSSSSSHFTQLNTQLPQELYSEQIVQLEGLIPLSRAPPISTEELRGIMRSRYLLEITNQTNFYLFPTSIKQLHPEFDEVIKVILKTDPQAMVLFAIVKIGRDQLPTQHIAIRHDLMHPSMPNAAIYTLKQRLAQQLTMEQVDRIRILPPLDEGLFRALQLQCTAILDPFPVGLHIPIYEAILDNVPVITAPKLQECTSNYAVGMIHHMNRLMQWNETWNVEEYDELLPQSAEEYGVLAVRLSKEPSLRVKFTRQMMTTARNKPMITKPLLTSSSTTTSSSSQMIQIIKFVQTLKWSFGR